MATTNTTRTLSFPTEILLAIVNHCSRSTLRTLALLNSGLSDAVTRLLYTNVEIRNLDSLKQFVRTLTDLGRPHLKNIPLFLDIDLGTKNQITVSCNRILLQDVISHTPNLQSLALLVVPGILERVFQNIRCSFALTRLTCPLPSGKELVRFLNSQYTLEELVLPHIISPFSQNHLADLDPQSLPNLRSVLANVDALGILIPGRPINTASTWPPWVMSDNYATLAQVLSQSTAQLDVVEISLVLYEAVLSLSNDDGLFPVLRRYSVQPRRLTLDFTADYKHGWSQAPTIYQDYYSLLKALGELDLDGFARMEIFELAQSSGPNSWMTQNQPFTQEYLVFETMKQPCPSMKMLKLFGLEIR